MPKIKHKKDAQVTIRMSVIYMRLLQREADRMRMTLAAYVRELIDAGRAA